MSEAHYTLVEHDGGWAYSSGGVFSETFTTRDAAHRAAEAAAGRQERGGEDRLINFEDPDGHWHDEYASGSDRPRTIIDD